MREIKDIKEIQGELFGALCYFDDLCRAEGLRYVLSNGTLLGAAKYRSFVPWDDDADVLMPREDYNKLMALASVSNARYKLFCREQVPEWRMPYAKLSCENTLICEGDFDFGAQFGVSVDIFPIDGWGNSLIISKIKAFRSECLKRLMVASIGKDFATRKKGIKRFILKMIWVRGKKLGHERVRKRILGGTNNAKRCKYSGCRVWTSHITKEIFPSEYFERFSELEFCSRRFPVIEKYERYLDSLYGDWRPELPPERCHSNHEIRVWYRNEE